MDVHHKSRFLGLPRELRDQVYALVFNQPDPHTTRDELYDVILDGSGSKRCSSYYNSHLHGYFNLLLVSQQIRQEAFYALSHHQWYWTTFTNLATWLVKGSQIDKRQSLMPSIRHLAWHFAHEEYEQASNDHVLCYVPQLQSAHINCSFFDMTWDEPQILTKALSLHCKRLKRLSIIIPQVPLGFLSAFQQLRSLTISCFIGPQSRSFNQILLGLPLMRSLEIAAAKDILANPISP